MSWKNLRVYKASLTSETVLKLRHLYADMSNFHIFANDKYGMEYVYSFYQSMVAAGAVEPIVLLTEPTGIDFKIKPGWTKWRFFMACPEFCADMNAQVLLIDMFNRQDYIKEYFPNAKFFTGDFRGFFKPGSKNTYKLMFSHINTQVSAPELEKMLYNHDQASVEYFNNIADLPSLVLTTNGKPIVKFDGGRPGEEVCEVTTSHDALRAWMQWVDLI